MRILFVPALFLIAIISCNTPQQSVIDAIIVNEDTVASKIGDVEIDKYPFKNVSVNLKREFSNNNVSDLGNIYQQNGFEPLFTNRDKLRQGLLLIRESKYHGLSPYEYGFVELDSLYALFDKNYENDSLATIIELKLSKAIYLYCNHLAFGKLNPIDYNYSWNFPEQKLNFDSVLFDNLKKGRISNLEMVFEPGNESYRQLKKELKIRLNTTESNPTVLIYPKLILKKGDSNIYVSQIKKALLAKGYYNGNVNQVFNDSLETALKYFQRIHSLNSDGVPGKRTYAFLNWDNERYINVLKINLERLRWLPDSFEKNGIVVNIPAAIMHVNKDSGGIFESKLVVGKFKKQTPVYYSEIDYLVFNPCWTVPNSIATEKMLPKIKKDSNYLRNRNMFIGLNGVEQETAGVDFSKYSKNNFPYKIYQRTGSGNALGKVKFMFHNPYSVYLHDTPSKSLFNKDLRAFSHGCIRVHKSMDFANLLLYELNSTNKSKEYYLKKGYPEIVNLKNRIPISLLYLTSFYNRKTGAVNYSTDIYSKDLKVLVNLESTDN